MLRSLGEEDAAHVCAFDGCGEDKYRVCWQNQGGESNSHPWRVAMSQMFWMVSQVTQRIVLLKKLSSKTRAGWM